MTTMWVLTISSGLFYLGIILLAVLTLEEGPILGTVIVTSTILLIATLFYGLK